MNKIELRKYLVISLLIIIVCFVVQNMHAALTGISLFFSALFPLLLGCVLAYLFNIILGGLESKYFPKSQSKAVRVTRRPVCVTLSFLIVILLIAMILTIVIPELIRAVKLVSLEIPPLIVQGKDFLIAKFKEYPEIQDQLTDAFNEFDPKSVDWASLTGKVTGFVQTGVVGIIKNAVGIVGAITGTTTNIVLALIFAAYLLIRKDKVANDTRRLAKLHISPEKYDRLAHILGTADKTFRSFFIGQVLEAIILGTLCFIGMKILRLPYAAMSGTLVGVTALIPIVGAFLGAGISAFIIFTENPMQALIFVIFLIILQQIEGNIIYPKVVGNSIGLPGIWVLAAITLGGGLLGILGMLVGVPVAATAYKLLFEHIENREALAQGKSPEAAVPAETVPPEPEKTPQPKPAKQTSGKGKRSRKKNR